MSNDLRCGAASVGASAARVLLQLAIRSLALLYWPVRVIAASAFWAAAMPLDIGVRAAAEALARLRIDSAVSSRAARPLDTAYPSAMTGRSAISRGVDDDGARLRDKLASESMTRMPVLAGAFFICRQEEVCRCWCASSGSQAPARNRRLRSCRLASFLSCLCAFLEDSVHPDLRRHVIDAQVVGPLRDLPVERIVGLELEVQKPTSVTPVSAAPGVVACGRLEVATAEQRRNVIEDGAQQCMGGVGVAPAVVVVQLGDKP
jgi:hypothetical protein